MGAADVFKQAIGKTWVINPRNVSWLLETVVKPILLYGATVSRGYQ